MTSTIRKSVAAVMASAPSGSGDRRSPGPPTPPPRPRDARPQREALSSSVAAKVKAAALEKVPGATVVRTEAGGPYGTPYHAHIKTSGGTAKVVLVNASFEATAVQADKGRGGKGRAATEAARARARPR